MESDALQSHCGSESAGLKQQDLLCPPNYNTWKCENQVSYYFEISAVGILI